MIDLKQETSLFDGILVFEISCSVELSIKKFYNLGARLTSGSNRDMLYLEKSNMAPAFDPDLLNEQAILRDSL